MASYIAQVNDGTNTVPVGSSLYGTCSTAASTASKVVTMSNFDTLINGVTIHVKFTNTNTASNPTLNVNNTGAKAIMRYGTTRPSTSADTSWNAGAVITFTYDGTYWQMNDWINSGYSLPIATTSVVGGIKSGGSLTVNSDGTTQVKFYDKSISSNVDKLAMGCIDEFGHNKLAFLGAQYIAVEYSNDAGSTWTDYGATDEQKVASVTTTGSGFVVGKKTSGVTINDQVRMTIQAAQSGSNRIYTASDHLLINISTSGAGGCKAKIETLTIGNVINNVDDWVTLGIYDVAGYSGWNSIPCSITFGGNTGQTNQIGKLRITLIIGALSSNPSHSNRLQLIDVRLIGHTNWAMPSELARAGHLYTMDTSQNATFPAKVTASGGFTVTGSGNAVLNINGRGATIDYAYLDVNGGSNNARPLVLQSGNKSTGNVGIGVIQPTNKLEVDGNINATGTIKQNGTAVSLSGHTHTKSDITDLGTIGAAASKSVDSSIAASSTSTNLPTSGAVASFVEGKGYTTNTGTVTTTGTMTNNHVVVSNGSTIIKDSGYTIAKSVPSDAVFTDTTYSSMTVEEGTTGTATTARTVTAANLKQIIEAHSSGGGSSVLKFQDTIVPVSAWVADTTYDDYPYRASIALTGVTAAMCPQVYFSMELINEPDVVYSPLSETYAGGVYIYADSIPQSAITIPSIVCI